ETAGIDAARLDFQLGLEHGTQSVEQRHHLDRVAERDGETEDGGGELAEGAVEGGERGDIERMFATGGDREDTKRSQGRQAGRGDCLKGGEPPGVCGIDALPGESMRPPGE